jgi:hypothetical protein
MATHVETAPLVCLQCGVAIHSDTAAWNAGFCMACAKKRPPGAMEKREMSAEKYLAAHDASFDDARQAAYQVNLSNRLHGPGGDMSRLPECERQYFLLSALLMQLREGGIFCFFDSSSGGRYGETVDLLDQLNLGRAAGGLREAKEVLFGASPVPEDVDMRRQLMPTNRQGEPAREVRKALAVIDENTENIEAEIEERMREIARANQLY